MIDIQKAKILSVELRDYDADIFIDIMRKLWVATKQAGFIKPFDPEERRVIEEICFHLELEEPEEVRIHTEKELIRED